MEFNAGTIEANSGMSKYIYDSLLVNMGTSFPDGVPDTAKTGFKKLAYSIASGLIDYIKTETKITGLTATQLAGTDGNLTVNTGTTANFILMSKPLSSGSQP